MNPSTCGKARREPANPGPAARRILVAGGFLLLLAELGGGPERTWAETPPPAPPEAQPADFLPEQIKANLQKQIQESAAQIIDLLREAAVQEIRQFGQSGAWEIDIRALRIMKSRDQQMGDVDRLLEQIGAAFTEKQASANYTQASRLLAEKGVTETLRFLESKSAEWKTKIAAHEHGARRSELRKVLREKLLAASLLEKDLQLEKAQEQYRAVIATEHTWAEPRNDLARLLIERGDDADHWKRDDRLREAVKLCRETLRLNPRASSPQEWAMMQNNLGNALRFQGEYADGAEAERLLHEAEAAFRAALQVRTRKSWPHEWAVTQNSLGNALRCQGVLTGPDRTGSASAGSRPDRGAKAQPRPSASGLLGEAVTAHRAALQILTWEQWPWDWAAAQYDLGLALTAQGERAGPGPASPSATPGQVETGEGAEGPQLLGAAVAAFREALRVYTREQMPDYWAQTQWKLSSALRSLAKVTAGEKGEKLQAEAEKIVREEAAASWR